ncbi:MAG: aspartate aminotransferase family protein [Terriglobia bacterium]
MTENSAEAVFPRNFAVRYPSAVRGEGSYLFDETGKKYLDACGGAAVVTIGHGVPEIIKQIAERALPLPYVHSSQFHTRVGKELASLVASRFPGDPQHVRVYFTSGGSEATETAIKIVRQYWLSRGQPQRYKILSRWHSYHGTTLGALALSGNLRRRKPYEPFLPEMGHISACFCYRCPLQLTYPACELACAHELEAAIAKAGKDTVAAFILEPVVGATNGAVPPEGYLRTISEICHRNNILLLDDEVLTGAGRTGRYFAVEHWNVVPDLILLGKGLSSGYAPLGAVLVAEKVWRTIQTGSGTLEHGFTYQEHPPSLAAGLAVQRYLEEHRLVERARQQGDYCARRVAELRTLPCVGDVRGLGLLWSVEFVADRDPRTPFPLERRLVERLFEKLRERGVLVYPMRGTADGVAGEHIMLAPPFIIEKAELDFLVREIREAITQVSREL